MAFLKFRIISFLTFFFLSISLSYSGEKQLYFFGGGGEPDGPSTIFDGHINVLSQFINANGSSWHANHSFDGGHEQTEKQLQSKLGSSNALGPFTEKNFLQTINNLEKKLISGELKSGNQLLLIMDTHGAVNSSNEKTHSVALSSGTAENLKTLSGASTVSMDLLSKLTTLASEKGVRLAIIDLSCFSGNTLKIANKNVCVISASGDKHYAISERKSVDDNSPYSTFGGRLLERMKTGENLEELFLKAREGSVGPDFPMISTDNGLLTNDLIYKMISPYLIFNQAATSDFSESYDTKNLSLALCKTENKYSEIKKRIDEIAILASIPKQLLDTTKLNIALEAYRQYQINYELVLINAQKAGDEIKDAIRRDHPDKAKFFSDEDGLSILIVNREKTLKMFKEMAEEEKREWGKNHYQIAYKDLLMKDEIIKEASAKLSNESKTNIKKFDEIYKYADKTETLAGNVSTEAKTLYDKLYRANLNKNVKANPCRDFIL